MGRFYSVESGTIRCKQLEGQDMNQVRDAERLTDFRANLDDLSRRIDSQKREFEQTGELTHVHRELMRQINDRHDLLRRQVETAAREGTRWDLLKAEFVRDFSSIFDNFLQLEERLEASSMKKGMLCREAGACS
jgi:hypothetical protein